MTGVFSDNLPSDMSREVVPSNPGGSNAKTVPVGVAGNIFPIGEATVLVLDHFRDLWPMYLRSIPKQCNVLFVRDTTRALEAMRQNPGVRVVIAQGLSRRITHHEVDAMLEAPVVDLRTLATWCVAKRRREPLTHWIDSHQNTLGFLKDLQQQGFGGLVQVVSRMSKPYQQRELCEVEGLRVQYMDKESFFTGTFTSKADGLWRRIERLEEYERKTGRPLSPTSPAGGHFDEMFAEVIYPHPAEDRLFKRWEEALSNGSGHRATAAEMALTWLDELKLKIKSGDTWAIYAHASQLPDLWSKCDCMSETTVPGYAWMGFFHTLHDDFNLAIWEILDAAGLTEWMRLQLELDMACLNPRNRDYGKHVSRSHGNKLREFFQPEGPSDAWVLWRPKRRC